ncbi:Transcriptional repressor p66-alpha [Manacus vitellinus]|uniref:Transcriptional repressor p66-alpha n=2 Tax=Pipridae TaxID=114313 RepID=A0A093Q5Q7_9PASS|nr:Transcriptional repressor p66-alpha [Manacus vitellinus]
MTEETCRTRSQKRALERDVTPNDVDSKKLKMEKGLLGTELNSEGDMKIKAEPGAGKVQGLLKAGEVKATIKVEVQTGDEPVDMSTSKSEPKREKRVPSPDVIVLSDNEPSSPRMNGLTKIALKETSTEALMKSSPEERERMIKQLKEELRLEEAKLVLLKKLRQSQIQKETTAQKPAGSSGSAVTPPPLVRGPQSVPAGKPSLQTSSTRIPGTVIPPPLVRGGQQASSKLGTQQNTQIVMPPLVRGAQQIHTIRQHSSTGPPPLLLAPRASVPSVQIQGQRIIQQGLIRVANVPNASLLVNIPQVSPQPAPPALLGPNSRDGLAWKRVGIPPGTPPAVLDTSLLQPCPWTLLHSCSGKSIQPLPCLPVEEFLPGIPSSPALWQWEAIPCVLSLQPFSSTWWGWRRSCRTCWRHKALKLEHTTRLKAAFVKALQQEQEIEQRILQQTAPPGQPKAEPLVQHHSLKQVGGTGGSGGDPGGNRVLQNPPRDGFRGELMVGISRCQMSRGAGASRGVLHSFSPSPKLQSPSASLGGRAGKHVERSGSKGSAAWKKSPLSTGGALPFVSPSLAVHKSASAVDRQREYLLDMIPPRSIPQSATWK